MSTPSNDHLTEDETLALVTLERGRSLHRPGFRGLPFKLATAHLRSPKAALRFDEAVIASLVTKGLLVVAQGAQPNAARVVMVPFTVVLTTAGEKARREILATPASRKAA